MADLARLDCRTWFTELETFANQNVIKYIIGNKTDKVSRSYANGLNFEQLKLTPGRGRSFVASAGIVTHSYDDRSPQLRTEQRLPLHRGVCEAERRHPRSVRASRRRGEAMLPSGFVTPLLRMDSTDRPHLLPARRSLRGQSCGRKTQEARRASRAASQARPLISGASSAMDGVVHARLSSCHSAFSGYSTRPYTYSAPCSLAGPFRLM